MVRTFVTPGGHRRFSRAGLLALLPDQPTGHPTLSDLGETPDRMAHGYRQAAHHGLTDLPFVERMDDEMRHHSRELGRTIVTALVSALDREADVERTELLAGAEEACREYGRIAGRQGLGSTDTAEIFLRFRRPFLDQLGAVARRRELDATATSNLMADANAALDTLLLATLRGREDGA
jgi:hypothetical protein